MHVSGCVVSLFSLMLPFPHQLVCCCALLLENVWKKKKKKSRGNIADVVQNLLAVWASGQDMSCFWIWEQLVLSRVAVTSQTVGFITCLGLRFSDLSLLKHAFGSVFCPLTVESLTNLIDFTGNLWLFFCFLSTYFQTWAHRTCPVHTPEWSLYLLLASSSTPADSTVYLLKPFDYSVPYSLFPAWPMQFIRVHLQHNAHWQLTSELLNNWWSVECECFLDRCVLVHLYKTRINQLTLEMNKKHN